MPIDRISTLTLHQDILVDIQSTQAGLGKAQKQISSGKVADTFADLSSNGQVERVINLEERQKKVEDYITNNKVAVGRINATDNSVNQIIQIISDIRDTLTLRRSSAGTALPVTQICEAALESVTDNLNLKFEGRYIFSGSKTDTKPVSDEVLSISTIINKQATSNYYRGDSATITIRASDTLQMDYGVRANDIAFQHVYATLHLAIEADETNNDELFAQAVDAATTAISELVEIRAKLNNGSVILSNTNDSHDSLNLYLTEVISDSTNTDIPTATIKTATDQTTLQAIFQTFARISRLTLSDYLR